MNKKDVEGIVQQVLLIQQDRSDKSASETVSHLFSDLKKEFSTMKEDIRKLVEIAESSDERITVLEKWMEATKNYSRGLIQGSKGTWIAIASSIGIGWAIFGEFIKRKLGS